MNATFRRQSPILSISLVCVFAIAAQGQCPLQGKCRMRQVNQTRQSVTDSLRFGGGAAKIFVPFDARVFVNDREVGGYGTIRWYPWNPAKGESYQYVSIRGSWTDKATGKKRELSRKVVIRPGKIRPVNLCGSSMAAITESVIAGTNRQRQRYGLSELTRSESLSAAAQKHADNMARQRNLAHHLDGRGFVERSQSEGYSFASGAENIAEGAWSSDHVVDMWMRSPGHRRNLLGSSYTEIGIGTAWSDDGTRYDVQVFGRPTTSRFLTSK